MLLAPYGTCRVGLPSKLVEIVDRLGNSGDDRFGVPLREKGNQHPQSL